MVLITVRNGIITAIATDTESESIIDFCIADFDNLSLESETAGFDPEWVLMKQKEMENLLFIESEYGPHNE